MASTKPLVLVLGGTGFTGKSIVQGLLKSGDFRVAALTRPSSASKPATEELRASGVDVRVGELTDDPEKLKEILKDVNIVVSAISAWAIEHQKEFFRVAKEVGVERVIPCDFATPSAKGVNLLHDQKLAILEYVKELGVPYTVIDVGWWMQGYLPLPLQSVASEQIKAITYSVYGTGEISCLLTDLDHIGTYVARIIVDPRTLNHAVIVWEDEVSQNVAHELGERASVEGEALRAKRIAVSAETLQEWREQGRAAIAKDPNDISGSFKAIVSDYMYSQHILGENTLENAKKLGYLDARELYPDIPAHSFAEFAKKFYSLPDPGAVHDREF